MSYDDKLHDFIPEAILDENVSFTLESSTSFSQEETDGRLTDSKVLKNSYSIDGDADLPEIVRLDSGESDQVVVVMDISDPLTTLQTLLEDKIGYKLGKVFFSLQDSQILDHHKNLVDLCVQGEGVVQINCEIKKTGHYTTINIADVLKPAEEFVEISGDDDGESSNGLENRWVVDVSFKKNLHRLGIPQDPAKWAVHHVRHWVMWAIRQFDLSQIQLSDWEMTGAELIKLTREEFRSKVPVDTNAFWTHFELLRMCKIVAVMKTFESSKSVDNPEVGPHTLVAQHEGEETTAKSSNRIARTSDSVDNTLNECSNKQRVENSIMDDNYVRIGSGPVQLWQFLLELLTNSDHRNAIQWLEDEGEFKLINPELVAHLWGIRKNKPTMNYEKLSRAIRYYYDGNMIAKVHGKRFVYKFVCDLKKLIGYTGCELNSRVVEAELRAKSTKKLEEESHLHLNEFMEFMH